METTYKQLPYDVNEELLDRILKMCCEDTGVSLEDVKSSKRHSEIVFARSLYNKIASTFLSCNKSQISRKINRDRSSLYNYDSKFDWELKYDEYKRTIFKTIKEKSRALVNDLDNTKKIDRKDIKHKLLTVKRLIKPSMNKEDYVMVMYTMSNVIKSL